MSLWNLWTILFSVVLRVFADDQNLAYTDRVTATEAGPHEITVLTTKTAPVAGLHIKIDLFDLYDNRNYTVYNLPGMLLQLTRGNHSCTLLVLFFLFFFAVFDRKLSSVWR